LDECGGGGVAEVVRAASLGEDGHGERLPLGTPRVHRAELLLPVLLVDISHRSGGNVGITFRHQVSRVRVAAAKAETVELQDDLKWGAFRDLVGHDDDRHVLRILGSLVRLVTREASALALVAGLEAARQSHRQAVHLDPGHAAAAHVFHARLGGVLMWIFGYVQRVALQ
jgi:hypothetical protein